MSEPIYLITGVTGATGGAAARELHKQGRRVRGLIHKDDARAEALRMLGLETSVGDLLDLDSVRRAMEGVAGAYFVYPFQDGLIDAAAFTAQAAIETGVQSLVNMSQKSARREAKSHAARDHWVSERVFDWSGVPTTHIRPTFFAEWLLYPLPGWQVNNGVIRFPLGRGRHAPIAADDQGRLIAAVLTNPVPHAGKAYPLFGPIELDHYQIAEKLSATLGRPFRYEPLSIPQFVTEMQRSGLSARFVQHIASVAQDYQDGIFAGTNGIIETITGKPPLTVEEFVARNRAKFDLAA